VYAQKGDWVLKQILRTSRASKPVEVLSSLFASIDSRMFLTVRTENTRAIKFYKKMGMKKVGNISWSKGRIPGDVWCYG